MKNRIIHFSRNIKITKIIVKYALCILLCLSIFNNIYSQIDSTYIKPFSKGYAVKFNIINKINTVIYKQSGENTIKYEPNIPIYVGIGFIGKNIALNLNYGFKFLRNKYKGDTRSFDIQYHYYGKKIFLDAILQVYHGYYFENKSTDKYVIYDGLETLKVGISAQYIFNYEKFSYRAAFSQHEKQLKSAGSALVGIGMYYSEVFSNIDGFFSDNIARNNKINNIQLGPDFGYAYNWVISENIYALFSISGGFNFGINNTLEKTSIYPTVTPLISMGYNGNNWSLNLFFTNNLTYLHFRKETRLGVNSGSLYLSFLRRFSINKSKLKWKILQLASL